MFYLLSNEGMTLKQEHPNNVTPFCPVPRSHTNVKTLFSLLDPGGAPVKEEGVLRLMEEVYVLLADVYQPGRPVESPVKQGGGDGAVNVKE